MRRDEGGVAEVEARKEHRRFEPALQHSGNQGRNAYP